ncbi:hypothetical protein OVS_01505 [Mycoplasma ovis str. Michigan]|uniref:Uncharacterized protein n=1 Tax=Mycoplasma ovis str. Michigan TaxID=1415773 RepID=A0ABN4BRM4_9MOLU|nr:hypothetical protein [Mycoplasma ovis]AHC40208.1 hypothetical protein OVS_01505 [Mycoplasma ovis str. Michigan]
MRFSGGAFIKEKIAGSCILLLGGTAVTGLACTEIYKKGVSSALEKLGGWVAKVFNYEGSSTSSSSSSTPLDPIAPIKKAWGKLSGLATTVVGIVPAGYEWIKKSENSQFLATFFKSFWNFNFAKNIVFNFHTTVRAWLGVLFDSESLSKIPDAITKFKSLAKFLSKSESLKNGSKDMINWLYLRFFVNPRRTINVLWRGQKANEKEGEDGLKCNGKGGKKKKGQNLPLGICFICSTGQQLIDHMINFLKEGTMPPKEQ